MCNINQLVLAQELNYIYFLLHKSRVKKFLIYILLKSIIYDLSPSLITSLRQLNKHINNINYISRSEFTPSRR